MEKNTTTPKGAGANMPKAEQVQTTQPQPSQAQTSQAKPTTQDNSEELKAEVIRLRALLAKSPENLDDKIKFYQRKQELIKRLENLENTFTIINEHVDQVSKEAAEDLFTSDTYKLSLTIKKGYNSESDVLQFRNPVIIAELLAFVLARVARKRDDVQNEIQK